MLSLRTYSARAADHAHPWHQIVIPVDGAMGLMVEGKDGKVDDSAFAVLPSNARHVFREVRAGRFAVLDVPTGAGWRGLPDALVERAAANPFRPMDDALRHLVRYAAFEAAQSPELTDRLASLLIESLAQRLDHGAHRPAALLRALNWADRRGGVGNAQEMAAAAGLSLRSCHNLFRKHLGVSPGEFLLDRRLDRAERLILDTTLSLAEIALESGFGDQSALTRSLRQRRLVTPAALRRAGRAKEFAE